MKEINKFLIIISLILGFSFSSMFAMEEEEEPRQHNQRNTEKKSLEKHKKLQKNKINTLLFKQNGNENPLIFKKKTLINEHFTRTIKKNARPSTHLANEDINQLDDLFSTALVPDMKIIVPDVVLRSSNLLQSPNNYNQWRKRNWTLYLEKLNIYGNKIKNNLFFNIALGLHRRKGNIKICVGIKPIIRKKSILTNQSFINPDGTMLASGSCDKTIKLQNIETGKLIRTFKGHESWVWSVAFSPDGTMLASGSNDKTIKLWDIETGKLIRTFTGHKSWVFSVVFSPYGTMLASGSCDKTIKLWNIKTGKLIRTFTGHKKFVLPVVFSPNGTMLASGSCDKTIKLWDIETGKLIRTFKGHKNSVLSVAFSPDGTMLASGSLDSKMKLWNIETGQEIRTFEGHKNSVLSVAFSPDGTMIASTSKDKTAKLWKLYNKQKIEKLKNKTSTVCLLLLHSIQNTYKHEGHIRDLKLQAIFELLQPNEKELVKYFPSDITNKKKAGINLSSKCNTM